MHRSNRLAATIGAALLTLVPASSASAATEVGNRCVANTASFATSMQISKYTSDPIPLATPIAGIVTKWKLLLPQAPNMYPQKLKVLRATGSANQFTTVAESPLAQATTGENTFDVRIPVQAGDRFGLYGPPPGGALACVTGLSSDVMGTLSAEQPVGSTATYSQHAGYQVAVLAIVEPDVDGDGFGDETQDKCLRSTVVQIDCPMVELESFLIARRNSILALVAASSSTPITVSATAIVPGGKKARREARASAAIKLPSTTQTVVPGAIGKFVLKLPTNLKRKLRKLSRRRRVRIRVTARTTDLAGRVTSRVKQVKVRGQAKRRKKGRERGGR